VCVRVACFVLFLAGFFSLSSFLVGFFLFVLGGIIVRINTERNSNKMKLPDAIACSINK